MAAAVGGVVTAAGEDFFFLVFLVFLGFVLPGFSAPASGYVAVVDVPLGTAAGACAKDKAETPANSMARVRFLIFNIDLLPNKVLNSSVETSNSISAQNLPAKTTGLQLSR